MRAAGIVAAGLGTLIGVVSAGAADLKKAPILKAPPAPLRYNWSGCHIGVQGGGIWGTSKHTQDDVSAPNFGRDLTDNFDVTGFEIGGTLGCDYQINNWVGGIEEDISWIGAKGTGHLIPPFSPAANTAETNARWLDTLRARLGVAWDRWFLYGTGGAAFAKVGVNICSPLAVTCRDASQTVTGWTAGAGMAYALWNGWSVKLEYLYVDLGTSFFPELQAPRVGGGTGFYEARDVKLTNNIVRAGLDYKLDWPTR